MKKGTEKIFLNGNKYILINNNFSQWTKYVKQKTQDSWLYKRASPSILCLQKIHFRPKD